jgi:parallel beta-helix repeat protein
MLTISIRKSIVTFLTAIFLFTIIPISFPNSAYAAGTAFYVDAVNGSDTNDGKSENTPWKSLDKVNSVTYQPGDKILFRAGNNWTGQLAPKGSGASDAPITIDMYGDGNKPLIQANGEKNDTIYLKNQSYWEINNLEVTNTGSTWGDYRGISINGDDYGEINHIYIQNCDVHDVNGLVGWISGNVADSSLVPGITRGNGWNGSKNTGGIVFNVQATSDTHVKTTFNNVLVKGNTVANCSFGGIIIKQIDPDSNNLWAERSSESDTNWAPHTNITFEDNYIDQSNSDHACNAIYMTDVKGGTIQNNVVKGAGTCGIEMYFCDSIVAQKNEVFNTTVKAGGADSNGIDADKGTTNIIIQHNYVHDNGDGILFCEFAFGNCIVRYNILQNNAKLAFNLHSDAKAIAYAYNNIIYTSSKASKNLVSSSGGAATLNKATYYITNNIFYSTVSGPAVDDGTHVTYDHNSYYGVAAPTSDLNALTADPLMIAPGTGGNGSALGTAFNSLEGYRLQSTSPCINSGASTFSNGTLLWNGGTDFWGDALYNSEPDIGACEYTITGITP